MLISCGVAPLRQPDGMNEPIESDTTESHAAKSYG
nr:MAG TPA: hypothetical protein [Caudoviricetes sp.]